MGDPVSWNGSMPATRQQASAPKQQQPSGTDLADILERVLDKGIVIAGDIQINLLDIELLTIKLRLVVASVDKAKEMGIDWWERDPTLSSGARELEDENKRLRERVEALERRGLPGGAEAGADRPQPHPARGHCRATALAPPPTSHPPWGGPAMSDALSYVYAVRRDL